MEKRNTILLTVIAIATLLVAVVGATFAYFASNINTENGNVDVNVNTSKNKAVFLSSASGDINIKVDSYMMQEHEASSDNLETSNNSTIAEMLNKTANINVSLQASEDNQETTCTYDLVFVWDEESASNYSGNTSVQSQGQNGNTYYKSKYYERSYTQEMEDFKELTVEVTATSGLASQDPLTSADGLSERNIDTLSFKDQNNGKLTLISGEEITSRSTSDKTLANYEITFRFYNLQTDQSSLMNKTFKGKVMIDNVVC